MTPLEKDAAIQQTRSNRRAHCVREIVVSNEGHDELIRIKAPDLSLNGMFITTSRHFPVGTVLKLQLRLAITGAEICSRCEVRHSIPGVGIGVEFVGLSSDALASIRRELALSTENQPKTARSLRRSARRPNRRRPSL
jgi:PilZ domain-containing protein